MINCLIVDDEPVALDILEGYVRKTPFLNLVGRCLGVTEAMRCLSDEEVHLIFLDIQMPDISGLEFSKTVDEKTKIIFTTAYADYALEGFKVKALDYLLKPFSYVEFLKTANRALDWFKLVNASKETEQTTTVDSLFVKTEYKLIKIPFDDIRYIEGVKDYVKFHLMGNERPVMSLMSLKILETNLPAQKFMRVHRSFIVNLDKIRTIQRNVIYFEKVTIPVAEKYKDQFLEFVKSRFFE